MSLPQTFLGKPNTINISWKIPIHWELRIKRDSLFSPNLASLSASSLTSPGTMLDL